MRIALPATHDAAEKAYEEALKQDPQHLDSWNNLGITRVNTGDVYGAKAAWQSALGVNRTYCKAHANLGFLAQSRGQIEEAVVEFTTTLSYCPEQPRRALRAGLNLRRRAANQASGRTF